MAVSQNSVPRITDSNRWFHGRISAEKAEQLLLTKGCVGSFLVRESRSNPGNYTLSVKRESDIVNVLIYNNGDYYDIATGSEFASLTDLILYYTERGNPLKEENGNLIEAKYPLYNAETPPSEPWYHGRISAKEAEGLLLTKGRVGSFLVRESGSKPGNYTLSVRRESYVVHTQIDKNGDYFDIEGKPEFASLAELILYYTEQRNPIKEFNGNLIEAKYPLCNTETPSSDPWFHGRLDSKLAETLLIQQGILSSFLVRERSKVPGEFVLCVLTSPDVVKNVIVLCENGEYFLKAKFVEYRFPSLSDLVENHKKKPIIEGSGVVILLGKPFEVSAASPKQLANQTPNVSAADALISSSEKHLEEFEQLRKQDYHNKSSRTEGQKPNNQEKNRYKSILPFDDTRVILSDGEPCDYINANYIKLPKCRVSYIATQGCMVSAVPDFWRMIWQEGSQIIVMITKLVELGKNTCTRYWPCSPEKPFMFDLLTGRITVHFVKSKLAPSKDYEVREFLLVRDVEKSDQPGEYEETGRRTIFHYNYTTWPDKSVPKHPKSLLDMLKATSEQQRSLQRAGPVVVHCSTGVGRTGTFIALGLVIDELQCKGVRHVVNVMQVVADIRKRRSGLVETEEQYKFIYDAIQSYIECCPQ